MFFPISSSAFSESAGTYSTFGIVTVVSEGFPFSSIFSSSTKVSSWLSIVCFPELPQSLWNSSPSVAALTASGVAITKIAAATAIFTIPRLETPNILFLYAFISKSFLRLYLSENSCFSSNTSIISNSSTLISGGKFSNSLYSLLIIYSSFSNEIRCSKRLTYSFSSSSWHVHIFFVHLPLWC